MEIEIKDFYRANCELVPIKIDANEFWSATLGSGWEDGEAWISWNYLDGSDWDKLGKIEITGLDPNGNGSDTITKTLGIEELVKAYEFAQGQNFHHCGQRWHWEDQDLCTSDGLIQIAMFGDVVWG